MKNQLTLLVILFFSISSFTNCSQSIEAIAGFNNPKPGQFFEYRIREGRHSADFNSYIPVHSDELNFVVMFDSTSIYETIDPANQVDINKLYGFADNNAHHHEFSARFGWNWSHGSLKVYAYVYNNGIITTQELTGVAVGIEYNCSIKVSGEQYIFTINNTSTTLPRNATTHTGDGYKLYPYFGGDETAPHDIRILIKEL